MKASIIFIGESFSSKEKLLVKDAINCSVRKAKRLISFEKRSLFITIYRFGNNGNSGFTKAKDWIEVTVPVGDIDLKDLEGMLCHELHHIARGYCGLLEKGKHIFLNTLFSEGLAVAFEIDCMSDRIPSAAKYNKSLIEKWLPLTRRFFKSSNYNYGEWFHGENGKPKQLGYRIGKYLVDEVLKRNSRLTHRDLVRMSATDLFRLSQK